LSQRARDLEARLAALESERTVSAGQTFWSRVEAQVPGARQINAADPLWHEFLAQPDPLSGIPYRSLGESAIRSGDVGRLVSLFKLYESSSVPQSGSDGEVVVPAAGPTPMPRVTRSTPSPSAAASRKPYIKQSEITAFYEDVARQRYKNRPDELKARESLIESAVAEGRVLPG
jgi:hypothetical protein